ncbi:YjbF family lipoprotein [Phaeovulum vinaykumarii]|uniref:Group 4 capsule polysaccharide lipoprotein gfcB, YjbF n=1 Tax=Phaeovulum vinaykumarii TaxID=407234 RepID=A0A1N7MHZ5_9RHOB|nr:YjbF family lipoprotein [Phaeovulum vinaykumarii]SIS85702.1 Group 4 capsule polysaccharide lipoprotein gfcB, YjbF [Phaeovulum vinaykumarii]SOC12331.1 group 4 capsule polysaccharide lipoprotein GfcB/YjbF [Phaeovulum vinaykumarii]
MKSRAAALVALACLSLAGCSGDTARDPDPSALTSIGKALMPAGLLGKGKAAPPTLEAVAVQTLAQTDAAVMVVHNEAANTALVTRQTDARDARRVLLTAEKQSFELTDGLVTATRGTGGDLMSAETAAAAAAIKARRQGSYQRTWRILDNDLRERPVQAVCATAPGKAQDYTAVGRRFVGRQMVEVCQAGSFVIQNSYLVERDGFISVSRQWLGPQLGYFSFQFLRR